MIRKRTSWLGLLLLASVVVVDVPARAIGTVTVSASDLRLSAGQECGDVTVRIAVPYDIPDWSVDLNVTAPDGSFVGGGYYYDGADLNDITDYVNLCDYEGTGTYTVTADVEAHDDDYNALANYRVTDTFSFSKQPMMSSNFGVRVHPWRADGWTINGRLTRGGGYPWANKRTEIQVFLLGSWRKLYVKSTNRQGLLVWKTEPKVGAGKYRLRLYAAGTANTKPAVSRPFRLPAR